VECSSAPVPAVHDRHCAAQRGDSCSAHAAKRNSLVKTFPQSFRELCNTPAETSLKEFPSRVNFIGCCRPVLFAVCCVFSLITRRSPVQESDPATIRMRRTPTGVSGQSPGTSRFTPATCPPGREVNKELSLWQYRACRAPGTTFCNHLQTLQSAFTFHYVPIRKNLGAGRARREAFLGVTQSGKTIGSKENLEPFSFLDFHYRTAPVAD
jgi:hypothetical protein